VPRPFARFRRAAAIGHRKAARNRPRDGILKKFPRNVSLIYTANSLSLFLFFSLVEIPPRRSLLSQIRVQAALLRACRKSCLLSLNVLSKRTDRELMVHECRYFRKWGNYLQLYFVCASLAPMFSRFRETRTFYGIHESSAYSLPRLNRSLLSRLGVDIRDCTIAASYLITSRAVR